MLRMWLLLTACLWCVAGCVGPFAGQGKESSQHVSSQAVGSSKGFRSPKLLADHYAKHGHEYNFPSPEAYERFAKAMRDVPAGERVIEGRERDGTIIRFDRKTGAFLAFDSEKTIRTLFWPNDGERYFQRCLKR